MRGDRPGGPIRWRMHIPAAPEKCGSRSIRMRDGPLSGPSRHPKATASCISASSTAISARAACSSGGLPHSGSLTTSAARRALAPAGRARRHGPVADPRGHPQRRVERRPCRLAQRPVPAQGVGLARHRPAQPRRTAQLGPGLCRPVTGDLQRAGLRHGAALPLTRPARASAGARAGSRESPR